MSKTNLVICEGDYVDWRRVVVVKKSDLHEGLHRWRATLVFDTGVVMASELWFDEVIRDMNERAARKP